MRLGSGAVGTFTGRRRGSPQDPAPHLCATHPPRKTDQLSSTPDPSCLAGSGEVGHGPKTLSGLPLETRPAKGVPQAQLLGAGGLA